MSADADTRATPTVSKELESLLVGLASDERAAAIKLIHDKGLLTVKSDLEEDLRQCEEDLEEVMQMQQQSQTVFDEADEAHSQAADHVEIIKQRLAKGITSEDELEDAQIELTEKVKTLQAAQARNDKASAATEACLLQRAKISGHLAQAKQDLEDGILEIVPTGRSAPPEKQLSAHPEVNPGLAVGTRVRSIPASQKRDTVTVVIRIASSLKATGIVVDASGVVLSAPGGLFDDTYRVVGINGKRFVSGMENQDGPSSIILRCHKTTMLQSISRVPAKNLNKRTLKLLQVMVTPDAKGFGLDLTDFNCIARVVDGGAGSRSDIAAGDIIVGVDGVDLGSKRLVEGIKRGKKCYVFTVIRPAKPAAEDSVPEEFDELTASESAGTAGSRAASAVGVSPAVSETPVVEIIRAEAVGGAGITVEWRADNTRFTHYQLEWKLETDDMWTHTAASSALKVTVVTKGNLQPTRFYQFRVRGCAADGTWGDFCSPSAATRPDGKGADGAEMPPRTDGTASEPKRARSTVSAAPAVQKSTQAPSSKAAACPATVPPAAKQSSGGGLSRDTLVGVLQDQRQGIEANHEQELADLETNFLTQLRAVQTEADESKEKFLALSGSEMQSLIDAKKQARKQVIKEITDQQAALEEAKEAKYASILATDAAHQRVKQAEADLVAEKEKAERIKLRMLSAEEEAKEEVDKAAEAKIQFVMRNAAMELRDQLKKIDQQHSALTDRKVTEAVKLVNAKNSTHHRRTIAELEQAHALKLQTLRSMAGAEAGKRISDAREGQGEKLEGAVRAAIEEAEKAAVLKGAAAVEAARLEGYRKVEEELLAETRKLNQQLVRATEQLNAKVEESSSGEEALQQQITAIIDRNVVGTREAVQLARQEAYDRAALQREQMEEAVAQKVRDAVAKREYELVQQYREEQRAQAAKELKELEESTRAASQEASDKWGEGNDDFEERVLASTQPASLTEEYGALVRDVGAPTQMVRIDEALPDDDASVIAYSDFSLAHPHGHTYSSKLPVKRYSKVRGEPEELARAMAEDSEEEGGDKDYDFHGEQLSTGEQRLRERHLAETRALQTRQEADELLLEDYNPDVLAERREAAMEELRQRQLDEAIALGAASSYQEQLQRGAAGSNTRLLTYNPPDEDEDEVALVQLLAGRFPKLQAALTRVKQMEQEVKDLSRPQEEMERALDMEKREHQRTTAKLVSLLRKRGETAESEVGVGGEEEQEGAQQMSEAELSPVREGLQLLQLQDKSCTAMQAMLHEISPDGGDADMERVSRDIQQGLSSDETARSSCATSLRGILAKRSVSGRDVEQIQELLVIVKEQQEVATARKAQLKWLHAECARKRIVRLHQAKAKFEELQQTAALGIPDATLEIPCQPIAAVEDETSIAVDWLPPISKDISGYHLQWREVGALDWSSSEGSENLTVPCCSKGNLRAHTPYEFRVRARDREGKWGGWTQPSDPTATVATLDLAPTRTTVRALDRARIEVRWGFDVPSVTFFELQWRKAYEPWDAESSTSVQLPAQSHVTPSLHPGSVYVFRVRASIPTYSGSKWTPWSQPSVPIQPTVKDTTVVNDLATQRARNLTQARRMLKKLGRPMAQVGPSEIDTVVSFPPVDTADQREAPEVVPQRRRGGGTSIVSFSDAGQTEVEARREVRAAAEALARTSAAAGVDADTEIKTRLDEIDELHQREKEQLRALEERAAELESKHDIGMIEAQIIDKVGKAERDPTGVVKLPATAADGTSSEIGSVTFRVQAGGNNPLDTLD